METAEVCCISNLPIQQHPDQTSGKSPCMQPCGHRLLIQLLRLQAFQPRVFAADSAACTVPAQRRAEAAQAPAKRQKRAQYAQQVAVSQEAVLLEMARMGAGLVQSIQPIMVD